MCLVCAMAAMKLLSILILFVVNCQSVEISVINLINDVILHEELPTKLVLYKSCWSFGKNQEVVFDIRL